MSDLGSLSQCLVDGDSDARVRARRLRNKALALSLVIEGLLVVALLVWPLFSPAVLATSVLVTPTPPYSGGGGAPNHPHVASHHPPTSRLPTPCLSVCAPVARPSVPTSESEPPNIDPNEGGSGGPGIPGDVPGFGPGIGLGVPGSTGDRGFVPEPPHAETPHTRPAPRSEGVMAALLVHRVDPSYPPIAKAMHVSGIVHLHAIIGKDGAVRELVAVDGNPILAQAARIAVQNWRYQPTRLNGEPVEVETYITVTFVLN